MNAVSQTQVRILACICSLVMIAVATADPDEASIVRAPLPAGLNPLLALIVDTSNAAMSPLGTRVPYDAGYDYGSALPADVRCESSRVFWRRGPGPAPDCRLQAGLLPFPSDSDRGLQCEAARTALDALDFYIASRAAQWRAGASGRYWTAPRAFEEGAVKCRADADTAIDWDRSPFAEPYIFYTGNFLNWLRAPLQAVERPLVEHVASSLANALRATDELEVAWIRFPAAGADGGYVAGAPVAAAQAADRLNALAGETPAQGAPLAEALVESALWLAGAIARFGAIDAADDRAFDPLAPGHYLSPISHACRPVTLAYLTPGQATDDELAGNAAATLPGFVDQTGGCGSDCLAAVAHWLPYADLRADLPGIQSVATQILSVAPPPGPLASAASPDATGRLDDPLGYINLVARSLQHDAAVASAPQLSAPALLPATATANAADVVYGLSAPQARQRWNGNFFRYALRPGDAPLSPPVVVDRDGENAIGGDALPLPSSRSAWSDVPDAALSSGGAAGRLPTAEARALYAELGDAGITAVSNRLRADNPRLEPSMLGLGAGDAESMSAVLDWLAEERQLGDPGPYAPAVATYPDARQQLIFAATHDGLLHAFDAGSGIELWAWMPGVLLHRLADLMRNEPTTVRSHGIDGTLVLHRFDPDGDGRIDTAAGEHFWLLFGLGRGGNRYYALDVANAEAPRLLWSFALPGDPYLESRAEPVITRIHVEGANQNADRWVVLLAGGYDRRFDGAAPAAAGATQVLHLVDAVSGNRLWSAGSGPESDLAISDLAASLSAAPRVLDLDGDGHMDRAYAVDVTGGLWRFDFASGRAPADLAQTRLLAQLGTGPQRFYGVPDVSLARFADGARLAVTLGSGWLARPLDNVIVDRIYAIFDRESPTAPRTWLEADLHDAGTADAMPISAAGWFRRLDRHGPGEKVIGPTITFDHAVRFQTWQPLPPDIAAPCGPSASVRRLYAIDVRNGSFHSVAVDSPEDDAVETAGAGLPVQLRFGFPSVVSVDCPGCRARAFGIAGTAVFDAGYAGDPVRTSWRKLAPPPDLR